jgi:hypothetical protein
MAGPKQHFIPKQFLKRFSDPRGKLFVYRRDKIYATAFDDGGVGAERYFYSPPENTELDDRITLYENRLATLITQLDDLSHGAAAPPEVASEIVVHLTVRADFLRSLGSTMFRGAWRILKQNFANQNWFDRNLGFDRFRSDSAIGKMLVEHFIDKGKPQESAEQLAAIGFELIRKRRVELKNSMLEMLDVGDNFFGAETPSMAATAHRNALNKGLVPEERVSSLSKLQWRIDRLNDGPEFFILPDTIAIQLRKSGVVIPYILSSSEDIGTVVMPISKRTLLIGSAGQTIERKKIVSHLASCSDSFFVAPNRNRQSDELRPKISTNSMKEITRIILETSLKF